MYGGEFITDKEAKAKEQRDGENVPIYWYFPSLTVNVFSKF